MEGFPGLHIFCNYILCYYAVSLYRNPKQNAPTTPMRDGSIILLEYFQYVCGLLKLNIHA